MTEKAAEKEIYERDGQWYHYDETGDEHGPWTTATEARTRLHAYVHYLETGEVLIKKSDASSAETVTRQHIARVAELLGEFAIEMIRRGAVHDKSKLLPIELGPLQKMQELIDKEGQVEFGTMEYKRRTALLGVMIDHHRRHNSHHPEHYEAAYSGPFATGQGIKGMDLYDLVEMFHDWKAASERQGSSSMNLIKACEKFNVGEVLTSIMTNTAMRNGWSI